MRKFFLFGILLVLTFILSCHRGGEKKAWKTPEDSLREVLVRLNDEISAHQTSSGLFHQRARVHYELGEINQALSDINQALKLDPKNAEYYITLSDIYLSMGNPQNCEEALLKAISLDEKNLTASFKIANLYLILKNYKKSDEYLSRVLSLDRNYSQAYFTRAIGQLEQGDTAKAIGNLMNSVRINQSYYEAYIELANLYTIHRDPLTEAFLNNALKIKPSSREALYMLGMYYQESSQFPKALATYGRLEKTDSAFKDAPYNMGYIYLVFLEDFKNAEKCFTRAIQRDPLYYQAWFNRGLSYEQLGDYSKAYDDYQQSLKIMVNYDKAIEGLNRLDRVKKKHIQP